MTIGQIYPGDVSVDVLLKAPWYKRILALFCFRYQEVAKMEMGMFIVENFIFRKKVDLLRCVIIRYSVKPEIVSTEFEKTAKIPMMVNDDGGWEA